MVYYKDLSTLEKDIRIPRKVLYKFSRNIFSNYKTVEIMKNNGEIRTLHVPKDNLKSIQRKIRFYILRKMPTSIYATAYIRGEGIVNNAKVHVGAENILKLDIRHFFDNITYPMVKEKVFKPDIFSEPIRILLSILCVYEHSIPQGAPTSPDISNIIMRDFDKEIGDWCKERNINYTRYCDDMTFSGKFDKEPVIEKVESELRKMGFYLNNRKTTYLHSGQSKNVTGIIVNEKLSAPRKYKKEIRQEIYYCKKYGIENHMKHSVLKKKSRQLSDSLKGQINFDVDVEISKEQYINSLMGRINYVLSVEDNEEMREYKEWLYGCGNTQKF
ncbi:reverse transcriptase family protein [Eubacterium ventriosum]|uniref:reverse transcriptase family protein n=1 Tax=Eubacterium ventriosum TaxID=39496 RepID=UPI0032BF6099